VAERRGSCPECGRDCAVTAAGKIRQHLGEDAVEVANNPGRVCADYLESLASRATTEETPR
jgi:hypothetical protein